MAKFTHSHNVCATIGTYKDRITCEEKKQYQKCGAAFTDPETGRMSIKLDLIPVTPEWSGWFSLFPADSRGGGGSASAPAASPPAGTPAPPPSPPPPSGIESEDDIPF